MSRTMLAMLIALAIVVVSVGGALVFYSLQSLPEAPDLTLQETFPPGFDRKSIQVQAAAFDGDSSCTGVSTLFTGREWGKDGVAYTTRKPTADDILAANPIRPPGYSYENPRRPYPTNSTEFDAIRADWFCEFRYAGQIWTTQVDVVNTEAVPIKDARRNQFQFIQTDVVLGGDGNGQNGTRFLVQGRSSEVDLRIQYHIFPRGSTDRATTMYAGEVQPILEVGGEFVAVFDVPRQLASEATLILVPIAANDERIYSATPTFSALFRLETEEAQLVANAEHAIVEPASPGVTSLAGGQVYRAKSLEAAVDEAILTRTVDELEAVSNTAFLIQKAVEPQAPPHSASRFQKPVPMSMKTEATLTVAQADSKWTHQTAYSWASTANDGTFTIRQSVSRAAGQVAAATADLTQIGADGLVLVKVAAEGSSAKGAIESARRLLDAGGHTVQLQGKPASGAALLKGADRYFVAAGALAAGWEWSEALREPDPILSFIHDLKAAKIVTETLFSLTLPGAIAVAATNLAAFVVDQLIPPELKEVLHRGVNAGILSRVTESGAREAFAKLAPELVTFAKANSAGILPYEFRGTKEVPTNPLTFSLLVIIACSALSRRRTRTR